MQRFLNPKNVGPMEEATHYGQVGIPGDGPYAQMWLKVQGDTIEAASCETYPCPAAVACIVLTTELVTGRKVESAQKIEPMDLSILLGGLPEGKGHCADRAVQALRIALQKESE